MTALVQVPLREGLSAHALLEACRPKQWLKNLLVLAAPAAAGTLGRPQVAVACAVTVLALILTSSALYLVNDVVDIERDRAHPTKSRRAVAAGRLSAPRALLAAAVLGALGLLAAAAVRPAVLIVTAAYVLITLLYTARLKHVPWLEMLLVASGFVLRTIAGAAAARVDASEWFLLVVSGAAVLLVLSKRSSELDGGHIGTRPVLERYPPAMLAALRLVASAVLVVAYVGWATYRPDLLTTALASASAVPVVLVTVRWEWQTRRGGTGAPEEVLLTDRWVPLGAAAWALAFTVTVLATVSR